MSTQFSSLKIKNSNNRNRSIRNKILEIKSSLISTTTTTTFSPLHQSRHQDFRCRIGGDEEGGRGIPFHLHFRIELFTSFPPLRSSFRFLVFLLHPPGLPGPPPSLHRPCVRLNCECRAFLDFYLNVICILPARSLYHPFPLPPLSSPASFFHIVPTLALCATRSSFFFPSSKYYYILLLHPSYLSRLSNSWTDEFRIYICVWKDTNYYA